MKRKIKAIVVGTSLGGPAALTRLFNSMGDTLSVPVFIVQHLSSASPTILPRLLTERTPFKVLEAEDKMKIKPGICYLAPPNYHLLIENQLSISLSVDNYVNFSRPSIDVLFESAARVYGEHLIGVLLTGANLDGSKGIEEIWARGGVTMVQDPSSAECDIMPTGALSRVRVDWVLNIEKLGEVISQLLGNSALEN